MFPQVVDEYAQSLAQQIQIEGREIRTPNLLIWSQTRCRCAIPPLQEDCGRLTKTRVIALQSFQCISAAQADLLSPHSQRPGRPFGNQMRFVSIAGCDSWAPGRFFTKRGERHCGRLLQGNESPSGRLSQGGERPCGRLFARQKAAFRASLARRRKAFQASLCKAESGLLGVSCKAGKGLPGVTCKAERGHPGLVRGPSRVVDFGQLAPTLCAMLPHCKHLVWQQTPR